MVKEDSLFRSIDKNRGNTMKQWRYHIQRNHHVYLQSLPIPHYSLQLSQADPWKIALHNSLSEWEADYQCKTVLSVQDNTVSHEILYGMDEKQNYLSLSSLVDCCCFTQCASPGARSFYGTVPILFNQQSCNHLLKDLDGTTPKVLVTLSKPLDVL